MRQSVLNYRNQPNQREEKLCLDLLIIGDLVRVVGTRLCDNCNGLKLPVEIAISQ